MLPPAPAPPAPSFPLLEELTPSADIFKVPAQLVAILFALISTMPPPLPPEDPTLLFCCPPPPPPPMNTRYFDIYVPRAWPPKPPAGVMLQVQPKPPSPPAE